MHSVFLVCGFEFDKISKLKEYIFPSVNNLFFVTINVFLLL